MGYIMPYIPLQLMHYASRMEKPKQGLPILSNVPPIQNETMSILNSKKRNAPSEKKKFDDVLLNIDGKGLFLNETI
jgi:hypothetical protein